MQYPPASFDPHTPTDLQIATPSLGSSPITPQQGSIVDTHIQTPSSGSNRASGIHIAGYCEAGMEGIQEAEVSEVVGLGFGSMAKDVREGSEEEDVVSSGFPTDERIRGIKRRLDEMEAGNMAARADGISSELRGMVRTLLTPCLEDLPFLHQQLATQRETIRALQQQTKLSNELMAIERSRMTAERQSWHVTTDALLRQKDADIASGVRPNRVLELDVGYHQELEAANKRLEMDNRLMAPRLADTQRQIDKLVTELQHLRSQVVISTHPFDGSDENVGNGPIMSHSEYPSVAGPSQPHRHSQHAERSARRSRSPAKAIRSTTMGDARTEHLLLAARKVRVMRQADDRVGRLTLEELKRGGVVGPDGGLGYSEGYGGLLFEDEEEDADGESDVEEKPTFAVPESSGKGKARGVPPTPTTESGNTKKGQKKKSQPATPGNSKSTRQPMTTPGGSNFSDLLRAAELATRPGSPTGNAASRQPVPMSTMSATRSTNFSREQTPIDGTRHSRKPPRGSVWKRQKTDRSGGMDEDDEDAEGEDDVVTPDGMGEKEIVDNSALDLLLKASQIDSPDEGTDGEASGGGKSQSGPTKEVTNLPNPFSTGLAPALELRQTNQILDHMIDPSLSDLPRQPQGRTTANATPYVPAPSSTIATPRNRPRGLSNASAAVGDISTPARNGWPIYQESPFDVNDPQGSSPPIVAKRERFGSISMSAPATGELGGGGGHIGGETASAFNSPTGGTVPGLGKYVHLTSAMPARRMRSPYLKWTVEEDELLARAVAMHGEKWDLVSKGVPTRSYHQVRQRWLRKTGAFDKKHGPALPEPGYDEGDVRQGYMRATSPTPVGGGFGGGATTNQSGGAGKKRRMSLLGQ